MTEHGVVAVAIKFLLTGNSSRQDCVQKVDKGVTESLTGNTYTWTARATEVMLHRGEIVPIIAVLLRT